MDDSVIEMEEEIEDEKKPKRSRPVAKRARNGSPDITDQKESKTDPLLVEAKAIQENLRVYLTNVDKRLSVKTQKDINGKVSHLIDIMETVIDRSKEQRALIERVVKETLSSPSVFDKITDILVERSLPRIFERLPAAETQNHNPPPKAGTSGINSLNNELIIKPSEEVLESEDFAIVQSRRKKKNVKMIAKKNEEVNEQLKGVQNSSNASILPPAKKTMADIVKTLPIKPKENAPRHAFVTMARGGKSALEIVSELPSPNELGVQAKVIRTTKAGAVLVRVEDENQAIKLLQCQKLLEKGIETKMALRRKPRLQVRGAPHSWTASELEMVIWGRLPQGTIPIGLERKECVQACFSSIARGGLTRNWVIEVHPMIRFGLIQTSVIDGGWWSLNFKDYIDPPCCMKCLGYDHSKASCTADSLVCKWCACPGHIAKECPRKKERAEPICANCVREGKQKHLAKHQAGCQTCPVHLKKTQELAKRTKYE